MLAKQWRFAVPHLYFAAIAFWLASHNVFAGNELEATWQPALLAVPFLVQVFLRNNILAALLAACCLFWTGWMLLAFLSDLAPGAEQFALWGGLLSAANVGMTCWLIALAAGDQKQ